MKSFLLELALAGPQGGSLLTLQTDLAAYSVQLLALILAHTWAAE